MRGISRIVAAVCVALFVGLLSLFDAAAADTAVAATSPQAWIGEYRVVDAHGTRTMTVIRDADRIEYRLQNAPVRIWRRVTDGVELRELHPERGQMIVFSPGDLRAYEREPEWVQISSLVNPDLRHSLRESSPGKAFGEVVHRYRGSDAQHRKLALDWLADAGMPAVYKRGERGRIETIELRSMRREAADSAFTATDRLHEVDGADLGD